MVNKLIELEKFPLLAAKGVDLGQLEFGYYNSKERYESANLRFLAEVLVPPFLGWLEKVVSEKGNAWNARALLFSGLVENAGYLITEVPRGVDIVRASVSMGVTVNSLKNDMKSLGLPTALNESKLLPFAVNEATLERAGMKTNTKLATYYLVIK